MRYIDVYEFIAKYYPIGIEESEYEYGQYSGIKRLIGLFDEKNGPAMISKWNDFVNSFDEYKPDITDIEVISFGHHPCFSADFRLLEESTSLLLFTRTIQVHISLLAPLYTVFGVDKVTYMPTGSEFNPIIHVSPSDIFTPWFGIVREKVESKYEGYKYINYNMLEQQVPGLRVSGADIRPGEDACIFQALFTSENISIYPIEGDVLYK